VRSPELNLCRRRFTLRYEIWKDEATLKPEIHARGSITRRTDAHARLGLFLQAGRIVAAARMCIHDLQEDTPDSPAFSHIPASLAGSNSQPIGRPSVGPKARPRCSTGRLPDRSGSENGRRVRCWYCHMGKDTASGATRIQTTTRHRNGLISYAESLECSRQWFSISNDRPSSTIRCSSPQIRMGGLHRREHVN